MFAANKALRIFPQLQFAEAHGQSVKQKQAANERLAFADDELQGLGGLNGAHDSRKHAEYPAFGAGRNQPRRRRFRIQTAIARPARCAEYGDLPFKAEDGSIHIGLSENHASVVNEITSRKIVRAIHHDVVILQDVERIFTPQTSFEAVDLNVGIQVPQTIGGGFDFRAADIAGAEQNLALKICEVYRVEIH